jgi:hypothetical protein
MSFPLLLGKEITDEAMTKTGRGYCSGPVVSVSILILYLQPHDKEAGSGRRSLLIYDRIGGYQSHLFHYTCVHTQMAP